MVKMRKCNMCKQLKPLTDFGQNRSMRGGGLSYVCKECVRIYSIEYRARKKTLGIPKYKHPSIQHYYAAMTRAKQFKRAFTITQQDCIDTWERDKAGNLERPSIDRIDNSRGYEPDNIRFIELSLNTSLGGKISRPPKGVYYGK